jgi:hypothetical protein
VRLLFVKMLGQLSVTGFQQGIVKGEGAVLASVERLRELGVSATVIRLFLSTHRRAEFRNLFLALRSAIIA